MRVIKLLLNELVIMDIFRFLDDESGRIVSDRGMHVLSNPKLFKQVMEEHNKRIHNK